MLEQSDDGMPTKVYSRMKLALMSERESLVKISMTPLKGEHEGKWLFFMYSTEDD